MFAPSNKLSVPVLGMSLAAISTVLYLSPVGTGLHKEKAISTLPSRVATSAASGHSTGGKASFTTKATTARSSGSPTYTHVKTPTVARPRFTAVSRNSAYPRYTYHPSGSTTAARTSVKSTARPTSSVKVTTTSAPKKLACYDFKYQQDAQAAYLANLSDPWGLDGAPGPANGDGLACTGWPVDPTRAPSVPADPYVAPPTTPGTKSAMLSPSLDYYGVAENGLPGDPALFDTVSREAGKAPSAVEWFSGWDTPYGAASVKAAWARNALPVITWMSKAEAPGATEPDTDFSFTKILNGDLDPYLQQYASDVVRTNLPVVIRFDHEMNGGWYPWGAGAYHNTPAQYIAVWQHIWNIFQTAGANENVMWLWSPARIDNLSPHGPGPGGQTQTTVAEDYPGDQYVDLVGATVYQRRIDSSVSYANSFSATIAQIEAVSSRPLFFPEIGAVQSTADGTDVTTAKVDWINSVIAGFLADPRVIGFVWFNNTAPDASNPGVTNDWRFTSSRPVEAAFKSAVADPRFASGVMPDGG